MLLTVAAMAQHLTGRVTDSASGEPIGWVNVYYDGMPVGTNTDTDGRFSLPLHPGKTLIVSFMGYEKQTFRITGSTANLQVLLKWAPHELKSATVKGKKKKYSRKNNPAVELMKKVIKAKKQTDIHRVPRRASAFCPSHSRRLPRDRYGARILPLRRLSSQVSVRMVSTSSSLLARFSIAYWLTALPTWTSLMIMYACCVISLFRPSRLRMPLVSIASLFRTRCMLATTSV